MVIELKHFETEIRSTWKVLKCGAGQQQRSVLQIAWKIKENYTESSRK
jgi:hypothetical protein